MKNFTLRLLASALLLIASSLSVSASAAAAGNWVIDTGGKSCMVGTSQDNASLTFITTGSGAHGWLVRPADPSWIVQDRSYAITVNINGSPDIGLSGTGIKFGGSMVIMIDKFAVNRIVADMPNGFKLRVALDGKTLFERDMADAHDAFAAYSACVKKYE